MGGTTAKKRKRVRRIIALRLSGFTIPEISKLMKKEGYAASERTVWGDLNDLGLISDHLPELLRKYYENITLLDDPAQRLKYLSPLIMKLLPSRIEKKIEGEVKVSTLKELFAVTREEREAEKEREAKVLDENK